MTDTTEASRLGAFDVWEASQVKYPNKQGLHEHPVSKDLGMSTDVVEQIVKEKLCVDSLEGLDVLDIGSGTGRTVATLRGKNTKAYGIEPNTVLVDEARERKMDQLSFAIAEGQTLPFADNCFNVVIFEQVLSAIPAYEKAIMEALRVLKPGGIIVINEMKVDFRRMPRQAWPRAMESVFTRNLVFKDPDILENILKGKGFSEVSAWHIPFNLPKQLMGYGRDGGRRHLRAGADILRDPRTRKALLELGTRMPLFLPYLQVGFYLGQKPFETIKK